jgi:hypothetical protein
MPDLLEIIHKVSGSLINLLKIEQIYSYFTKIEIQFVLHTESTDLLYFHCQDREVSFGPESDGCIPLESRRSPTGYEKSARVSSVLPGHTRP